MLLQNPLYSLIYDYIDELNKDSNLITNYKSYEKAHDDYIEFKCFNFDTVKKLDSIILKDLKYQGMLEFYFNKVNNELYVSKVPYIEIMNNKIPIFTNDLASIICKLVNKYSSDIKINFANPLFVLAIDKEVENIIPSIKETKNNIILNKIIETITKEKKYIEKNILKYKNNQQRLNDKKERVLREKRRICGLDPLSYTYTEDFNKEVNEKLCNVWNNRLNNINRHYDATINKYKELLLSCGCKEEDKFFGYMNKEKIYLLMLHPGIKEIDLDNIRVFDNDRDIKRRMDNQIKNYNCDRLTITIPKTLEFLEIKKLVDFAFENGKMLNLICEDFNTSLIVKELSLQYINDLNKEKRVFVNIEPDYYRNYFYNQVNNKEYWHRFDYTSDYKFSRNYIYSLDGKYDVAKASLYINNMDVSLDLIKYLVLGRYNNISNEILINTYQILLNYIEWQINKAFEEKIKEPIFGYLEYIINNIQNAIENNKIPNIDLNNLQEKDYDEFAIGLSYWIEDYEFQKRYKEKIL